MGLSNCSACEFHTELGMLSACARLPQGHRANPSSSQWVSKMDKGKMMGKCFGFPSVAGDYCRSCSTLPLISFILPAFPGSGTRPSVCVTGVVTTQPCCSIRHRRERQLLHELKIPFSQTKHGHRAASLSIGTPSPSCCLGSGWNSRSPHSGGTN